MCACCAPVNLAMGRGEILPTVVPDMEEVHMMHRSCEMMRAKKCDVAAAREANLST